MSNTSAPLKNSKIYIAGHTGLVGSAITRKLVAAGYTNLITRTRQQLDLTKQEAVAAFFAQERPEYVILAAAKVGGIHANDIYPADFINTNLAIQQNIINAAYQNQVARLLFLGSVCIYPKVCSQPIKEQYLLTGALEPTNRPYAIAKIAGIEQCWAYNRQYTTKYLAIMPANLYGPGDHYDLQNSHVLPALIRKTHTAKINNDAEIVVWGTGTPSREFLHTDDLAAAIMFLLHLPADKYAKLTEDHEQPPLINVGCGENITIAELAKLVKEIVGFSGRINYDLSKPDGTPARLLDTSKIQNLGWKPQIGLAAGIAQTYAAYLEALGIQQ